MLILMAVFVNVYTMPFDVGDFPFSAASSENVKYMASISDIWFQIGSEIFWWKRASVRTG